jgi:hypothetical protein
VGWIQTFSGRKFDFEDPRAEDVHIADIAHALSLIPRFAGHTEFPYSVAQHSLFVADIVERCLGRPEFALEALLHDAPEAYYGDITRPMKALLGETAKRMLGSVDSAVFEHFGMTLPVPPIVKYADDYALRLEAACLLPDAPIDDWHKQFSSCNCACGQPRRISRRSQRYIEGSFIGAFRRLAPNHSDSQ